jgi:nucleotide-binding universal stress UspA family protein
MALKDLLVHVDSDAACPSRIDVASRLAELFQAHLTGLHVMALPTIPIAVGAEFAPVFQESQMKTLLEAAGELERRFRQAASKRAGVPTEWRLAEGDLTAIATLHARYFDLTVVGQGIDVEGPVALRSLPEDLALAVGRPVLVVPRYGTFPTVGERVLVAWNGSREATRAVNDALPLLQRAAKVTVLSVEPEGAEGRRMPGADIALHLARHGVKVDASETPAADIAVGDVLLSYAADRGIDLIVSGAYGHSRMREVVLGGVTRHLLQHMTVPVLLSH